MITLLSTIKDSSQPGVLGIGSPLSASFPSDGWTSRQAFSPCRDLPSQLRSSEGPHRSSSISNHDPKDSCLSLGETMRLPSSRRQRASQVHTDVRSNVPSSLRITLPTCTSTSSTCPASPCSGYPFSPCCTTATPVCLWGRLPCPAFDAVEIIPGLFLSAHHCASDLEGLRQRNISLVVNAAVECSVKDELRANEAGVRYMKFSLRDHSDENIAVLFRPVTKLIHNQLHRRSMSNSTPAASPTATTSSTADFGPCNALDNGGVLVHCRMGVSRSATLIIAYLMLYGCEMSHRRTPMPSGSFSIQERQLWSPCSFIEEARIVKELRGEVYGRRYQQALECNADNSEMNVADSLSPCLFCDADPTGAHCMDMEEALSRVHSVKCDVNPNIGFVMALKELECDRGRMEESSV